MNKNKYFVLFILIIMIFGIFGCGGGDDSNPTNLLSQSAALGTIQGKLAGNNNAGVLVMAEKVENGKTATVSQYTSPTKSKHASAPIYSSFTDSTGSFSIEKVPEGEYFLQARQGNATVGQKMNVSVRSYAVTNLNIQITPTASVTGHVYLDGKSDHSKTPVYFEGTSYIAITDAAGNYSISNVPVGTGYTLDIEGDDDFTDQKMNSIEVVAPVTTIADITLMAAPVTPTTGNLTGKVVDFKGNIISNANVSLSGPNNLTTTSNASGDFSFGNIPVGNYQLSATIAGMNSMVMPNISIDDNNYLINGIVLILTPQNVPKGNIEGNVLTKNNSSPIIGATVSLRFNSTEIAHTTTDSMGHYSFSNIDEGIYTIRAMYSGFEQTDILGHVVGGKNQTLSDIMMEPMQMLPYIKGLIKFAFNGEPIVSMNVDLYDVSSGTPVHQASTVSDQSGYYDFPNLMSGDYYVSTEVLGYGFATVEVPVTQTGVIVPTLYVRPMLQALEIENKDIVLSYGETFDLNDLDVIAHYVDESSIKVKPCSWTIVDSPDGSIGGNDYTAGGAVADDVVQASYHEGGITVNAQINIHTGTEAFAFCGDDGSLYFINNDTVEVMFGDSYSYILSIQRRNEIAVINTHSNSDLVFFDTNRKLKDGYFNGTDYDSFYGFTKDGNYMFVTYNTNDEIYMLRTDLAYSNSNADISSAIKMGFGTTPAPPKVKSVVTNYNDTKLVALSVESTNPGVSVINLDNFSFNTTMEIATPFEADFIPETNYLLVANGTNGVEVLNLDDYTSYEVTTTVSAEGLIISPNGDKAFVFSDMDTQIEELDISNPSSVTDGSNYDFNTYTSGRTIQAADFNLDGSAIYLACTSASGLMVVRTDSSNPLGAPQTVLQDNTIMSVPSLKVVPASRFNPYANGL